MVDVFLEVTLPVALVAILGGAVGRWRKIPVTPISTLVFYLLTPALVFHSMSTTQLTAGVSLRIVAVMLLTFAGLFAAASLWSLLRGHDAPMRAAFALGATTPNVGNMGLSVAALAFGQEGLDIAVVIFVTGSVMATSAGVAVASLAGDTRMQALKAPFRFPALYTAVAGLAINALNIDLPVTIEEPARTLAGAAVPVMLVVLGLQLHAAGGLDNLFDTFAVGAGRLLVAPAAAYAAALALGLDEFTRDVVIVGSAMPTAVIAIIVATEFRAQPAFVTRSVVATTLASMATLSLLITLVR